MNDYFEIDISEFAADNVMVRSTGNEDRVDVANPGGNESFVCHKLKDRIFQSIGDVVSSYFSEKSMSQRLKIGDDITAALPTMACLVQDLVGEDMQDRESPEQEAKLPVSGVIYTDGNGNIRIQSAYGHGEYVVNSKGNTDSYDVTSDGMIFPTTGEKSFRLAPIIDAGTQKISLIEKANNPSQVATASIDEGTLRKLAEAGRKIEETYGMRMDIEFVIDVNGDINIVQARPIPEGDRIAMLPSALDPDYIAAHPGIEKHKGTVVTPDIMTASMVDKADEIIVFETIEQAESYYYQVIDPKSIKAVCILKPSPNASHEAGFFSSKAIPVLQLKEEGYERVLEWKNNPEGQGNCTRF